MIIKGDVTKNGKITPDDALLVLMNYIGKVSFDNSEFQSADVDNDGEITPFDATEISQHLSGENIIDEVIY